VKLGERGERDAGGTHGEGPTPGRKRKPKKPEQIAARMAKCMHKDGERPERAEFQQGVMPLNAGFDELERIRAQTVASAKARRAKTLKGNR
jgi:hypothetical protein